MRHPLIPAQVASRDIDYNADNMPTFIEHTRGATTVTTSLTYDGDSVRAKKETSTGKLTYYISDNFEVIGEIGTKYIFAGNLRVASVSAAATYYFHKDHLGSSSVMTDASGAMVESAEYMPFGHLRAHTGTAVSDYKFTDQEQDTSTGLYNYDARLYDPVIGRFISADTIVPSPFNPQSFNRYSYVINNPLIYVDPTGHVGAGFSGTGINDGEPPEGTKSYSFSSGKESVSSDNVWTYQSPNSRVKHFRGVTADGRTFSGSYWTEKTPNERSQENNLETYSKASSDLDISKYVAASIWEYIPIIGKLFKVKDAFDCGDYLVEMQEWGRQCRWEEKQFQDRGIEAELKYQGKYGPGLSINQARLNCVANKFHTKYSDGLGLTEETAKDLIESCMGVAW